MAAPVKFLFDNDFASGAPGKSKAPPAPSTIEVAVAAAVAEAEARAYQKGFAAGEAKAAADTQRTTATAMSRVADGIAQLARDLAAIETRLEAESVEVAVAVARKLAPGLMATQPTSEIAALASSCFRHLIGVPHVVVRIAEATYEAARTELERITHNSGFSGRLVILGEPSLRPGDCRIEWADGGLVFDQAATEAAIAEAVQSYIAARLPDRGAASGGQSA